MSGRPVPPAPAPGALGSAVRSWLHSWSSELWPSSDGDVLGLRIPHRHCHGAVRVLVADDNPVNLMVISELMAWRGLEPVLVADGAQAVALACDRPFDLVLMDLQMPILDGLDATSAIRAFERSFLRPAVPVIAYSCSLPAAGVMARHGLSGSLNKPCEDHDLEACLVRWCPSYRSAPDLLGAGSDGMPWQPEGRRAHAEGAAAS